MVVLDETEMFHQVYELTAMKFLCDVIILNFTNGFRMAENRFKRNLYVCFLIYLL